MSTPSFYKVVFDAIDSHIKKFLTAMPAIVKVLTMKTSKKFQFNLVLWIKK